ncbi:MAG TPA: c-type cytochrome [Gallionella sp.]|nr:c-type cytochrome [Gallionella sp.]
MFHISSNIATGLTLAVLLAATAAFAQNDTANPLKGSVDANIDSAESIKLRSGRGNPEAGREKSQLCQGCHGEYGKSTEPVIPSLAGQYGNYISKQIHNYQAGTRSHQIMNAMAATVSDPDLADIAAYFASQQKMKGEGNRDDPLGKELFLHGDPSKMRLACVSCHGVKGKGLEPKISMFPVIGGQQKVYIRLQLLNFRDGYRTNSPGNIMNRITESLTDDEIEALAEYVSQQ